MKRHFTCSKEWNDEMLVREFDTQSEAEVFAELLDMTYISVNDGIEKQITNAIKKQVAKYQNKKIKHLKPVRISITKQ